MNDVKKPRILVIEDHRAEQKILVTILEEEGYEVIGLGDGRDAIREAEKEFVNLALVDMKLPDMDGVDVLRKINRIDNETVIIMVTAHETIESILSALDAGAYTYLVKPFDVSKLKIIIKKSLDRQKLSIENKALLAKLALANEELGSSYKNLENVHMDLISSNGKLKGAYKELENANIKLKELYRLKSDFLTNISHELKTPLTSIQGYIDIIKEKHEKIFSEKVDENFKRISFQTRHLNSIIDNLLDSAGIEAGAMKMNLEKVNMKEVLELSGDNVHIFARRKGIEINIINGKNVPISILGDKNKLIQVFSNLLSNAVKFSHEKGTLEIGSKFIPKKKTLEIHVKDHGIGIARGKQKKIFNRFYQVDSSSTRVYGGTGLGLSVVKEIVEMHKGEIKVESEPDKGATFTVVIPALPVYKFRE